jgi:hypothetical protein
VPEEVQLVRLLQKSLEFEQSVTPDLRLFWDVWLEEKKVFLWIDINRLFQNATSWDEIFNERMVSNEQNQRPPWQCG